MYARFLYTTRICKLNDPSTCKHVLAHRGREEATHGRASRTALWQLPAGRPVGTGRLCRGVFGTTCATGAASRDQGAAYAFDWPGGRAFPAGSADHCETDAPL